MSEPTDGGLSAGTVFHGRYEIVRCLNSGGMGAIYECVHLKTRKRLALKVMLPQIVANPAMRARFELEARATADIESEHIVQTFDAGVDDATGAPFLVMELLRGEDLGHVLERRGHLAPEETVMLLGQAALALDKTHAAGIVHRDLKPENLFLTTRDDGSPRLKVLDFGIAKVVNESAKTGSQTATIGTPLYMSPEQILGEGTIGPRADLYSLGHIAFTLLSGAAYWDDEHQAAAAVYGLLMKVMAGQPEPATARAARRGVTLPEAFDAWFSRATARATEERFERAATLVSELATALGVAAPRLSSPGSLDTGPHPAPGGPREVTARLAASAISAPATGSGEHHQPLSSGPTRADRPGAAPRAGTTTSAVFREPTVVLPIRSRTPVVMFALAGLAAVGLGGFFLLRSPKEGNASSATAVSAAATAPGPSSAAGTSTAAPADPPAPSPAPSAVPAASVSSSPSAEPTSPKPVTGTTRKPSSCNPPYEIDSAGIRTRKPHCK